MCIRMFFAHFFWFASVWARIGRASQLPWRRSATCKRRPNKGGPCHAAPTAENHATGGSVSQIKAEPVTLQLPPRRSATCKRRPNKGGPCHVAPTVEKTRREHKSGTSRPNQAEMTTAPRQRPTAPRQRPDSAQTAPRGDRVIFGENKKKKNIIFLFYFSKYDSVSSGRCLGAVWALSGAVWALLAFLL